MKIAILIVRILLGALMVFASIAYFFDLVEAEAPTGDMATLMTGIMASKYMMPLVKSVELIAGLSLLSGKFMKVTLLALLPITINIFLIHTVTQVSDFPIAIFVLGANLFLIYAHWDSYKNLFKA
ncbi:DoxX family membrane protein [uncultured Flavobacterium sp.]|uniref:DoxX family membrane protein n=1 Tax=uncultured Flavobacterium sp. TaxID=165435 RepID=UPI0030EEDBCF|tara:strand:+ start:332876 stop:333250 length:375 start_codon:yes stop_codon:yes gene_type:complete